MTRKTSVASFTPMFRPSKVLAKIRAGGVARICSTGHKLPFYPSVAAHFGYDGVWVCAEHNAWDARECEAMLLQHRLAGIDCIWRTPTLEKSGIARLLEDGATGLMFPHVSTVEKARALVEHAKFPPLGERGLDGGGLDASHWVGRPADYLEKANSETFLVAQIETPLAVANVDAIAAVPGLEILFIGPGDLSLRLGCGASVQDAKLRGAVETVAAACRRQGKAWGMPAGSIADAKIVVDLGGQFLAFGSAFWAIRTHLDECAAQLDALLGKPA